MTTCTLFTAVEKSSDHPADSVSLCPNCNFLQNLSYETYEDKDPQILQALLSNLNFLYLLSPFHKRRNDKQVGPVNPTLLCLGDISSLGGYQLVDKLL